MGTPEFAIPSLRILLDAGCQVVAVITACDKPKGRGQKLTSSPIKQFALERGLDVLQPPNLKDPAFVDVLKSYKPDVQVVVAFRMLPEVVWSLPPMGTFNLHASLLPQYRGAAPINWAIINGEIKTGLTTFFIKHEIDTGSIIHQVEEEIYWEDDAGSLHDRLMEKGADLVLKTVMAIAKHTIELKIQENLPDLKPAPKIFKDMCEINWDMPAEKVYNFIRGLSPFPGAYARFNDKLFRILKAEIKEEIDKKGGAGDYWIGQANEWLVNCKSGVISILEIKPEGKRSMDTSDFLRGNTI